MGWGMDIVPDLEGRIINFIHLCVGVCVCGGGGGVGWDFSTLVFENSLLTDFQI